MHWPPKGVSEHDRDEGQDDVPGPHAQDHARHPFQCPAERGEDEVGKEEATHEHQNPWPPAPTLGTDRHAIGDHRREEKTRERFQEGHGLFRRHRNPRLFRLSIQPARSTTMRW